MYRCGLCNAKAPAGQARLVHRTFRADGSILTETAVCVDCDRELKRGKTAASLRTKSAPVVPPVVATPKANQPQVADLGQPIELS